MNLASQGGDPNSGILFVSFNQDITSVAIGTKSGFRIYSLASVDKLESIYENQDEEMVIVERLFSSSLIAVVSSAHPGKLRVCHFKKGTEICNCSYSNNILSVRLNRARLVVCLEESLYIHNIRDMKVLHTIRDTPPNPGGLCALSINSDNSFLAYPGSNHIGEVQVFDALHLQARTMIMAHDSPLVALAFNTAGTQLATASERGTVIRVWNVSNGEKLYEFRRGVKRCASIYSLGFSPDGAFLAASSNTETVHVFKLEDSRDTTAGATGGEEGSGWMGYLSRAVTASASYLPNQVTEVFTQGRAFAFTTLQFHGLKNCCALAVIQRSVRLLVASSDGYLYVYNVDVNEGGTCRLVKQHRLDGVEVSSSEGSAAAAGDQAEARPMCEDLIVSSTPTPQCILTETPEDLGDREIEGESEKVDSPPESGESEKCRELSRATEPPAVSDLKLDDSNEFPPMTQRAD